jgi:hypothetical protein
MAVLSKYQSGHFYTSIGKDEQTVEDRSSPAAPGERGQDVRSRGVVRSPSGIGDIGRGGVEGAV